MKIPIFEIEPSERQTFEGSESEHDLVYGAAENLGRTSDMLCRSAFVEESRVEGRVERSVLSPGVWIAKDAHVTDSILTHNVHVGSGAKIRRTIIGKGVHIAPGEIIGYDERTDRSRFHLTESGLVVIDSQAPVHQRSPVERTVIGRQRVGSPSSLPL